MIQIKDNQNRLKLNEGRNYQMGFAFCKKVDDNTFETVQPISPCKDYLNDVVYSENTGKPCSVFGLTTKKENIFTEDYVYMAIAICRHYYDIRSEKNDHYKDYEKDTVRFKTNINNVVALLNFVEAEFGLDKYTTITEVEDKYLFKIPVFWTKYVYLISLYSLLVRLAQYYDGKVTPKEFLSTYKEDLDKQRWEGAQPAYNHLITTKVLIDDPKFTNSYSVHNSGICSLVNPETGKVFSTKW